MSPAVPLDQIDIDVDGNTTKRAPDLDLLNRTNFSWIDMGAYEAIVDCNNNGIPDDEDIANGTSQDCNNNGTPDECDIISGFSMDCNDNGVGNGIPDECEIEDDPTLDCNDNGILDECEIADDPDLDCNDNDILDSCEIEDDPTRDCNNNGILDECECGGPSVCDEGCEGDIEIVFVLDSSGSMQGPDINGICNDVVPKVDSWMENLPSGLSGSITVLRLGGSIPSVCGGYAVSTVVNHLGGGPILVPEIKPGDNGACIDELLNSHDEAVAPGAAVLAELFDWSPNSFRFIIPAGDEPPCSGHPDSPSDCEQRDVDAILNLINVADANDVTLLPITGGGSSTAEDCTVDLWNLAGMQTAGKLAFHLQGTSDPELNYFEDYDALGTAMVNWLDNAFPDDCLICLCDHGPCPGDFNDDNHINILDLLVLLENWGSCADPNQCPWDLNCDGVVNVLDLLILLESWGECGNPDIAPQTIEDCYERYPDNFDQLIACIEMIEEIEIFNSGGGD